MWGTSYWAQNARRSQRPLPWDGRNLRQDEQTPGFSERECALPFTSLKFYKQVELENERKLYVENQYWHLKLPMKSVM